MVNALALATVRERGNGFLYFWAPGMQHKLFRKSMYPIEFYSDNDRYLYAEDLMFLEHFKVSTKKTSIDYGDRGFTGYGYYSFLKCHGEICQLMAHGINGPQKWFRQLTKNGEQSVDNKFLAISVDNDSWQVLVDEENNLYVSQSNNVITKVSTTYEDGIIIKKTEKSSVMQRTDPTDLAIFKNKVYDFSKNELRDTDTGKEIFRADANILSVNGIDSLLCSTIKGDIFDCTSGRKIYTNNTDRFSRLVRYGDELLIYDTKQIKKMDGKVIFDASQISLEESIISTTPISGDWLFNDNVN